MRTGKLKIFTIPRSAPRIDATPQSGYNKGEAGLLAPRPTFAPAAGKEAGPWNSLLILPLRRSHPPPGGGPSSASGRRCRGAVAAPFLFWQGFWLGCVFCACWAALVFVVWVRACSFVATLGSRTLTLYLGVAFPVERVIPRHSITSALIFRTPLLRLAGACVLLIFTPGMWAMLPGIPLEAADAISAALLAGEDDS